jgi:hypothetical protein
MALRIISILTHLTRPRNVKNKYVILRHLGDMCLFTSALRASVNKSHIPSLPQNNLYIWPLQAPKEFKTVIKLVDVYVWHVLTWNMIELMGLSFI